MYFTALGMIESNKSQHPWFVAVVTETACTGCKGAIYNNVSRCPRKADCPPVGEWYFSPAIDSRALNERLDSALGVSMNIPTAEVSFFLNYATNGNITKYYSECTSDGGVVQGPTGIDSFFSFRETNKAQHTLSWAVLYTDGGKLKDRLVWTFVIALFALLATAARVFRYDPPKCETVSVIVGNACTKNVTSIWAHFSLICTLSLSVIEYNLVYILLDPFFTTNLNCDLTCPQVSCM
jgi:hypothetical protein